MKIFIPIVLLMRVKEQVWGSFACDTLSRAGAPNSVFARFDPTKSKGGLQQSKLSVFGLEPKEEFNENNL